MSCIRGLGALLEFLWETRDFSRFAAEEKGLLSSCSRDVGVYLESQRKLGVPLELHQGTQSSS